MARGHMISGRYRLDEEIGRGGMGVVWRAHDRALERQVALKRLQIPGDLPEEDREALKGRFLREARAAARLDHPSIINVHDVIEGDGGPWIVMQYVQGRSLGRIVRDGGPLPAARAAAIGLALLDALDCAHGAGIVHRDVKPANVLVSDGGRVVLTDFGIAAVSNATAYTRTGGFVGTPVFMAPERFQTGAQGPASDLWSLGATLYLAVEGRPPFQADELEALIGRLLMGDDPVFARSGALEPVLRGLLERDPGKRWDSRLAAQGLKAVEEGRTPTKPLVRRAVPGKTGKPWKSVPVMAGLLALLVLAGVGVSIPFLRSASSDSKGKFESIPDACSIVRNGPVLKELWSNPRESSDILDWGPYRDHGDADSCTWSNVVRETEDARYTDATIAIRASLPRRSTVADLPHWTKVPGLGDAAVRQTAVQDDGYGDYHREMVIFTLRNAEVGVYLSEDPDKRTDTERRTRVLQIAGIIEKALGRDL